MKKSKLLIPALSVASVGAVVAPMVTSCSKAAVLKIENDYTFKSTTAHDEKDIKTAQAKHELLGEYLSNPKYFAEDYGQLAVIMGPKKKKADIEDEKSGDTKIIKSYEFNWSITINSVSAKEVEVELNGKKTKGYSLSASLTTIQEYKVERTKEQIEENSYEPVFGDEKCLTVTGKETTGMSFKNVFVYINEKHEDEESGTIIPCIEFWLHNQLAWETSMSMDETKTSTDVDNYTTTQNNSGVENDARGKEEKTAGLSSYLQPMPCCKMPEGYEDLGLHYFSKITYNIA